MKNAYKIFVRNLKERDHSEHLGVDDRIILEWILGKWWEGAQDRDQQRTLVNKVMKIRVP
jgi:hypothetical protein